MTKRILLTGATGFLGRNILSDLSGLNYNVTTLARSAAHINIDLSSNYFSSEKTFDIILHVAGKAHVWAETANQKKSFHLVNVDGTKNLCKSLENIGLPQHFVYLSSVSVYGLNEGEDITEQAPLLGTSPYAKSKIETELFLQEWSQKNGVILTILRPSLIAGIDPTGNLGAMITGIKSGRYFRIAGGRARKSVLMAMDIANLLPLIEQHKGGVFNICDNHHPSFRELEDCICQQLGMHVPYDLPYWIAKLGARVGDVLSSSFPINSEKLDKITQSLTFCNKKARLELGWEPLDVLQNFKIK